MKNIYKPMANDYGRDEAAADPQSEMSEKTEGREVSTSANVQAHNFGRDQAEADPQSVFPADEVGYNTGKTRETGADVESAVRNRKVGSSEMNKSHAEEEERDE